MKNRKASAVIGAGFGDEAKGLIVDYLAAQSIRSGRQTIVARFNGGAQAGHTVTLSEQKRHVFHHWGAGALAGASTYLGPEFACHPMLWYPETKALHALGANLEMLVHPRAPITVPFDIMINQAIEGARGHARHGSCGVGFGETMERRTQDGYHMEIEDLKRLSDNQLKQRLEQIAWEYMPRRLEALGLDENAIRPEWKSSSIIERFIREAREFQSHVSITEARQLQEYESIIFEGAQGLRLDEELGDFPFVTRSKTGLPHMVALAEETGLEEVEVTYATRAYVTRHGAGPLDMEDAMARPAGFSDDTNQPNDWQGSLRFAPLSAAHLRDFIFRDRERVSTSLSIHSGISISCLDQMGPLTPMGDGSAIPTIDLARTLADATEASHCLESWGPTRKTIRRTG